jgi:sugar-specific transcriptional regulator TrmB
MIYEILGQLAGRGAVMESEEGRATLYRPIDPTILLGEHQENLIATLAALGPELKQIYTAKHDQRLWSISDLEAIYSYARQMISRTTSELYLMANDTHFETLRDAIFEKQQQGTSISILATGKIDIPNTEIAYHPPLESQLQGIEDTLVVLTDQEEVLIAMTSAVPSATVTNNPNLVLISRQFIWMEFFTQRIYSQIGEDLLDRLNPADQEIFRSLVNPKTERD